MAQRKRRRADTTDSADSADNAPRQAFGPTEASNALVGNQFHGTANINFHGESSETTVNLPCPQNANNIGDAQRARKEREACLKSLAFGDLHARRHDIAIAHPDTCDWLFQTAEFLQWRDPSQYHIHNGVLWIKGKPGAGKSTLMKHAHSRFQSHLFSDHLIVAHFFNARGTTLEKTPLGLLRSIVYQMLQDDKLYSQFTPFLREKQMTAHETDWQWHLSELQAFIRSAIMQPPSDLRPLFILVDALDECDLSGVRDVVLFLESLSIHASGREIPLRICLSSRHYPSIHMKKVVELKVEGTSGHEKDIAKYIAEKIPERDVVMEAEITKRANSVFLWVAIVMSILNKAHDEGRVEAMQKALDELPEDLDKVFASILGNDADAAETLPIFQWVLLSERPLKVDELFAAVFRGLALPHVDIMKRRITTLSKGLVEVRKGKYEKYASVQFIHLSVKDFLYRRKMLSTIDPSLEPEPIMNSHGRLWARCWAAIEPATTTAMDEEHLVNARHKDPFLGYAADNVLYYAERALSHGITRADPDDEDDSEPADTYHQVCIKQWLRRENRWLPWWKTFLAKTGTDEEKTHPEATSGANLLYMLALLQLPNLVRTCLAGTDINKTGGFYGTALTTASHSRSNHSAIPLINAGADVNAQGGRYGNALQAACTTRENEQVVQFLLNAGADVNAQGGLYGNALQATCVSEGNEQVIQLLLNAGADVNAQGGHYGNALQATCVSEGNEQVIQFLLNAGADVNAQGGHYGNALQAACTTRENEQVVQLLLNAGADVNAQGGLYGNALSAARSYYGRQSVIKLLLEAGANPDA